ncbi:SDR family NAD(P)-dependent oxidoreductase [Pseudonocardiaceae bacterium YIM PH 21723]|nr:SDR family NAD(P)-dependent oxidoreductase [Pseudonocardiaceae bacterium YIM PH 21723]
MDGPLMSVALVTGATSGIGLETARRLAQDGFTVLVHGSAPELAESAVNQLASSGVEASRLHPFAADFSSLGQVHRLITEIRDRFPLIDVLVNNAATGGSHHRILTVDGHEQTFQVNYLAAYLLTRELGGAVRRVVNVSSSLHRGGNINWTDVNRDKRYTKSSAYAQSKLALTMLTPALLEQGRVAVSVHPGIFETALLPNYSYRGRPVGEAAEPVARLCTLDVEQINGRYFDDRYPVAPSVASSDHRSVQRLWKLSERLTAPALV